MRSGTKVFFFIFSFLNRSKHVSSQYIFEVLKADLEFVRKPKMIMPSLLRERMKEWPHIRHSINSLFVFNKQMEKLHLRKSIKRAVQGLDDYIMATVFKDLDTTDSVIDINTSKTKKKKKNQKNQVPLSGDAALTAKWEKAKLYLAFYAPYFTETL